MCFQSARRCSGNFHMCQVMGNDAGCSLYREQSLDAECCTYFRCRVLHLLQMQSVAFTYLLEGGSNRKYLTCFMQEPFTEHSSENIWHFALAWSAGTLIKAWDQVLMTLQFPNSLYWAFLASFCGQNWGPSCGERHASLWLFPYFISPHGG